ncbi:MAG: SDR family NAD(P)-dependent oxidoreductase, partial [Myxococcota bacterium]|nr:SDR family NAD(P)-dependent oxidoreductase [Myxococcota bacterium]
MSPSFTDPVLDGRVAVVTGGGTGIGRAVARALAERGAAVWINGRREEPLAETASANPSRIRWVRGDVTTASGCDPLIESIGRDFGALHVLVNNAAILGPVARLEECSPEAFDDVMKVNVSGLYRMTHALLPLLR